MNEVNLDWRYLRPKSFNPHETNLPHESNLPSEFSETFEWSHLSHKLVYDKSQNNLVFVSKSNCAESRDTHFAETA
jgi:hypothetical protein